jgi:uncharacterized small protein (DUF1192 family)
MTPTVLTNDEAKWLSVGEGSRRIAGLTETMLRGAITRGEVHAERFFGRITVHEDELRRVYGARYLGSRP